MLEVIDKDSTNLLIFISSWLLLTLGPNGRA